MTLIKLEKIGERIRQVRHAYRMTQQEMAEQLHITRSCLANYERGTRQPPLKNEILTIRYECDIIFAVIVWKDE